MQYIFRNDSIDVLPLSKRVYNCVRRAGVNTVGDFLNKSVEEWKNARNIGQQALDEILRITSEIRDGTGELILSDADAEIVSAGNAFDPSIGLTDGEFDIYTIYMDNSGRIIRDIDVDDLIPLPNACQALKDAGYKFASQLIGMSNENIAKLRHVNIKTKQEIKLIISKLKIATISIDMSKNDNASGNSEEIGSCTIFDELCNAFGDLSNFEIREIAAIKAQYSDLDEAMLVCRLYENATIRNIAQKAILEHIEVEDKLSKAALNQKMPRHLSNTSILEELLAELEKQEKILISDTEIIRTYPSVMKYVERIEEETKRNILSDRLAGKTLDAIGAEYKISRERVRQISEKEFRCICKLYRQPKFYEDKYLPIYSKYQLYSKDFVWAFGEPMSTFCYLDMIDTHKFEAKLPIESILTDDTISRDIRKKAEKIIYKNYITDNGVRVKIDRQSLVKHYVKQYCKNLTDYDLFHSSYNEWIESYGITNCELNSHTYKNFLSQCEYALWNWGSRFRYYNMADRDYTELLEVLDFDQYADIVISTAKWVRDYPDAMRLYDIRDGFELHNLLKKLKALGILNNDDIKFGKMPTITFGNGNVQNQIFDLIVQYAPISAEELSQKYEELYGVRADVLRGSPDLQVMDAYFEKGMYRIDHPSMTHEQIDRMTSFLSEDYYSIDEIKRIFKREFPDADMKLINTYSLKTLGFHVNSAGNGYVIRNSYQSASKYFISLLTKDPIFDTRDFHHSMRSLVAYTCELHELRRNYEIIEFAPSQYINIARLNELNISKDLLLDYCSSVAKELEIGEYFTVKSLRNNSFSHQLDDLGFDEWFYSSILAENEQYFSSTKIGGTRLFLRDTHKQQYSCSFEGLLNNILNSVRKMDFYDLSDYLINQFGINLPKEKIKEAIRESDLYYDQIMDTVYIDYDTYFEEI